MLEGSTPDPVSKTVRYASVQDVLDELVGMRCEALDNPYGSVLRFDIGPLGRRPDQREEPLHGWRHITILAPWRLESSSQVLGDWNLPGGSDGSLLPLVKPLTGQMVAGAHATTPGWDLVVEWSGGWRLFVFSDSNEDRDDSWMILGTDGLELGVGPAKGGRAGYELRTP